MNEEDEDLCRDSFIVIVTATAFFMVQSSWHCHRESSPGSFDECSMQRQVAADLLT